MASTFGRACASFCVLAIPLNAQVEWESRSVFGFQQGAASSSDPKRSFFFDFFIERGIDQTAAVEAKWKLWGNVRLASVPQQAGVPVWTLGSAVRGLRANELVQSAEFLSGFEYRLRRARNGTATIQRDFGIIVQYGATGPMSPKDTVQLFRIPSEKSAQRALFESLYGAPAAGATHIAFVNRDRGSFFKQYGVGFRVTTFDLRDPVNPPATFSFTLGQDQLITEGRYHGLVAKFDVFYPLPLSSGESDFRFLFLFGTVNTQMNGRPLQPTPLILEPAAGDKRAFDPDVMVAPVSAVRDTYRIGIGIDAVSLLRKLRVTAR